MDLEILVVELAGRHYGAPLQAVREVFTLGPLTPVPTAPAAVAGVANLRGQVIPVLDLMRLLDLGLHRLRLGDPVVLVESEGTRVGLLVDRVVGLHGPGATATNPADRPELIDVAGLLQALRAEIAPGPRGEREAPTPSGAEA
ncbi:MAG: chemotaxis protein CheW [Deltaproteobacteria bacterium]|nr:chemotaxis protein CheW [Deltaproteobacteria bacterium]